MIKTITPALRPISVLATTALVLTGVLGSAIPAQATDSNAIAAKETVASTALVEGKTIVVTGFASNSTRLTAAMQKRIERFVENNPDFDFVRCVGFADRSGTPATNKRLGIERATAGCDVAVDANPDVEVSRQAGKWDRQFTGADIRRVSITLSNYATANITTTFNPNGVGAATTARVKAGASKTLPSVTRPGFVFMGWFSDKVLGTKIGDAGQSYTPRKSQTIWAQWSAPSSSSSSGGSSGGSSAPQLSIAFSWGLDFTSMSTSETTRRDTDVPGGLGLFCDSAVTVTVKRQVLSVTTELGQAVISQCGEVDNKIGVAANPEDTFLGTGTFSGALQGVTPGTEVMIILEVEGPSVVGSDTIPDDWDGTQAFAGIYVITIPSILSTNSLVFDFRGYAS